MNVGNQNSLQKTEEKTDKKLPLEAEYRFDCRQAKSKESCKILAEELAKEKVLSQICSQIKSQTYIKTGDQLKVEKNIERQSSGLLQTSPFSKKDLKAMNMSIKSEFII